MEEGQSSQELEGPGAGAPVALDGAEEDEMLRKSQVLTLSEVARRRKRRAIQLEKLYRMQKWALLEEMRARYRRYYMRTGKSGWREEESDVGPAATTTCVVQGCEAKPMLLSSHCFQHILLDSRQQLYKPCAHNVRSAQSGICGKPVLRAVTPAFCATHFQLAQKQAARLLRKAANARPPSSSANANSAPGALSARGGAPKLHILITEYVRAIQSKRRAAS